MLKISLSAWFRSLWARVTNEDDNIADMPCRSISRPGRRTVEIYKTRQGVLFIEASSDYALLGTLPPESSDAAIEAALAMFDLGYDYGVDAERFGPPPEPSGP